MRCTKCGTENSQGAKFCIKCGTTLMTPPPIQGNGASSNGLGNGQIPSWQSAVPSPANFGNGYANGNAGMPIGQVIPDYNPSLDYEPLGMWAYFGYDILFAIPLIGLIFLIVFACGGTKNINLRNYARSKFCLFVILFAFFLLLGMIGGGLAAYSMM